MPALIDPASLMFILGESPNTPMQVGSLQLFEPPADAGPNFARELYESWIASPEIAPLFRRHPARSLTTAGQWVWREDTQFDIEHHVRHSALPQPGRVRELLDLVSRLHGTRLSFERPLWEAHVIEGLADGRIALYYKMHHANVDGVSAMRLLQKVLSSDPNERDMLPPWAPREQAPRNTALELADTSPSAIRQALSMGADAAGMPAVVAKSIRRGLRNEVTSFSFTAPRTVLNRKISAARRFAAQDWPLERFAAIQKATGTTLNDVLLAMCGGALRTYLDDLGELPDTSLVSMVPVSLHSRIAADADKDGGNAIGMVMVQLGTDVADAGDRLSAINASMAKGKDALGAMSLGQIMAMAAVSMSPLLLNTVLGDRNPFRPAFNLVISNVPGPKETQYFNGARMDGIYPLSIPMHGQAFNLTTTSYVDQLAFGLTGCRRTMPHLQRLLVHLDDELTALERAAGVV